MQSRYRGIISVSGISINIGLGIGPMRTPRSGFSCGCLRRDVYARSPDVDATEPDEGGSIGRAI
jgi:hypothetical protein